jgi:Phytanoyl-CoA dioxygenase (PhyH)
MRKLRILLRMLRNRFLPGASFTLTKEDRSPPLDQLVFVLNLFPPYNLVCWLWTKACGRWLRTSGVAIAISRFLLQRGFLFGALRHLSPEDRNAFSEVAVLPDLRKMQPTPRVSSRATLIAAEVKKTGYASLGAPFARSDAECAVRYFQKQTGYASQTPLQSDGISRSFSDFTTQKRATERYFCYSSKTSLACSQVRDVVNNPLLREVAAAYLGFTPKLYSVNTIATINGSADHYVMRMHRDYDAFASMTFFIYWTDVAADNGATIYIPHSHLFSKVPKVKVFLTGEAGQIFGLDTFGLHAGNKSVAGFRLATWCRFGSTPNLATVQDPDLSPARSEAGAAFTIAV